MKKNKLFLLFLLFLLFISCAHPSKGDKEKEQFYFFFLPCPIKAVNSKKRNKGVDLEKKCRQIAFLPGAESCHLIGLEQGNLSGNDFTPHDHEQRPGG